MIRLKTLLFEDSNKETDSTNKLRVLFVGDSQTAANWSYAKILLRNKLIDGKIVAKNGASTDEVLTMLQDNLTNNYDIVSIMAGGNDGASKTPNNAIKNFETMFSLVSSAGAKLVVVTNPSKKFIETDDKYYRKDGYPSNDKISNWLASQSKADVVIDTQDFDKLDFTKDHVHLDSDAHKKIAADWKSAILSGDVTNDMKDQEDDTILMQRGANGDAVKKMQTKLMELGFDVGVEGEDGKFGPHTEDGVKAFQKSIGKKPTGSLSKSELDTLMNKSGGVSGILSKMLKPITKSGKSMSLRSLSGAAGKITGANYNDSVETQASAILAKFEGLRLEPYWDVNNWRIGYGSSTTTDASGNVTTLSNDRSTRPDVTITAEDAKLDLTRRLTTEFIPEVMGSIGSTRLPDGAIAALVSICYNYGSLPNNIKTAARTGNLESLAQAVLAHKNDNSGVNSSRRTKEAAYILNSN